MNGISISTCFDYSIPIEHQFDLINKTGFSHISIGGNYDHSKILTGNGQRFIQSLVEEKGLLIDTIHGYDIDNQDTLEINAILANAARFLHVPVIVLHCSSFMINPNGFEDRVKDIMKMLPAFEDLAKDTVGVY